MKNADLEAESSRETDELEGEKKVRMRTDLEHQNDKHRGRTNMRSH